MRYRLTRRDKAVYWLLRLTAYCGGIGAVGPRWVDTWRGYLSDKEAAYTEDAE